MQQDQIYQILKQLIPELQCKIKQSLQIEYQQQMQSLQYQHEKQLKQIRQQLKSQSTLNQSGKQKEDLRKRVCTLQAQRKNWNKLQVMYQKTIQQLTQQLENIQNLTTIKNHKYKPNPIIQINHKPQITTSKQTKPLPSQSHQQNIPDSCSKSILSKQSSQSPLSINNQSTNLEDSLSKYLQIDTKPLKKTKEQQQQQEEQHQEQQKHYNSILSPPKQQKQIQQNKPAIFWNENKKKQLLSLIKLS